MFRRTLFGITLAPVFATMVGITAWAATDSDEDAIRDTVETYFDGMMEGRPELLRDAFMSEAVLYGITDRGILRMEFDEDPQQ